MTHINWNANKTWTIYFVYVLSRHRQTPHSS